jgi:hypothetical protein
MLCGTTAPCVFAATARALASGQGGDEIDKKFACALRLDVAIALRAEPWRCVMDRYFDTLPSFEHTSKRRKGFL